MRSRRLYSERRLNRILHVVSVNQLMNLLALLPDRVQKCAGVAVKNFVDCRVSQHGVQSSGRRQQFIRRASAASALDGVKRLTYSVDRIAQRVREIAIEQQKFQDAIR